MEKIKERAKSKAGKIVLAVNRKAAEQGAFIQPGHSQAVYTLVETSYSTGAKEQLEEDIRTAEEWLEKNYHKYLIYDDEGVASLVCWKADFEKAMYDSVTDKQ